MLGRLGAGWGVENESLIVTSSDAPEHQRVEVYDLAALEDPKIGVDFEMVIGMITDTVQPSSWSEAGGQGAIESCSCGGICALVIRQNEENHEKIADMLAKLRKARSS